MFFCNDINIPVTCNILLVQPEIYTAMPFDTVSLYGIADFFCYGHPQAGPVMPAFTGHDYEIIRMDLFSPFGEPYKFRPFENPVFFAKGKIHVSFYF